MSNLTYAQCKSKNICSHCHSKPVYKNHVCCESCMVRARLTQKRLRNRLKEKGLCQRCYKQLARKGKTDCESCSMKKRPWTKYRQPCQICGFEYSDIHHKDKNKQNNNPKNLISLCPNHHRLVHWNKLDLADYKDFVIKARVID